MNKTQTKKRPGNQQRQVRNKTQWQIIDRNDE
jgi:hypothetical protein